MLQNLPSNVDLTATPAPAPTRGGLLRRKRPASPELLGADQPSRDSQGQTGRQASWLGRMSVTQKLTLAGVLFGIPTLATAWVGTTSMNEQLMPVSKGEHIMPLIHTVDDFQTNLDQYTRMVLQKQQGKVQDAAVNAVAQKVSASLSAIETELNSNKSPNPFSHIREMRATLREEVPLDELKSLWAAYRKSAPSSSASALAADYDSLNETLVTLTGQIGHVSALEVGAGQHGMYFLKEATLEGSLLALRHNLIYAQVLAESISSKSSNQASDQENLIYLLPLVIEQKNKIVESTEKAVASGRTIPQELTTDAEKLSQTVDGVILGLKEVVQGRSAPNLDASVHASVAQAQSLTASALDDIANEAVNLQIQGGLKGGVTLLVAVLLSALAITVLVTVLRHVVGQLRQLNDGARKLAEGNLQVQVPVTSADEIGQLSASFNSAAEQLRLNAERNEHERLESQKLQSNISEFLNVTMDIAEGDLTKRGKVTDDVLGNVVDSINLMTEELAQVLKGVQSASSSVTGGSQSMLETTRQIQQGAQFTATQTYRVAQRVQEITDSIREMASHAQASADTARQALLASQQGQEAVQDTLGGMQNIRRDVQGIAKRIKSLGDRSLEIQEIVDTISQIAEQTHLLAVNASIEAAGAGEAGGRFSIVADSVRKLATTSTQATARVATLIKNVQTEIQDVVVDVEEGTREVEQGYRVAGTAGERLKEIGTLTQTSAALAEQIAQSTQAQVQGVEEMADSVQQIAGIAQDSQESVEKGRRVAEQLEGLAQQLNTSLTRFKLST